MFIYICYKEHHTHTQKKNKKIKTNLPAFRWTGQLRKAVGLHTCSRRQSRGGCQCISQS